MKRYSSLLALSVSANVIQAVLLLWFLSPRYRSSPSPSSLALSSSAPFCPDWLGGQLYEHVASRIVDPSDKTTGSFNLHSYETLYEKSLSCFRNNPPSRTTTGRLPRVKFLEIGIGPDGKMSGYRLFRDFFSANVAVSPYLSPQRQKPNRVVLGDNLVLSPSGIVFDYYAMELEHQASLISSPSNRWITDPTERAWLSKRIWWGDQSNLTLLQQLRSSWASGEGLDRDPFDVIVDDGSHIVHHQMLSFEYLFLNALKPGGLYVIEDLQTSFHPAWGGSRSNQLQHQTMVGMIVDLLVSLHFHWWMDPSFQQAEAKQNSIHQEESKMHFDASAAEGHEPYGQEMGFEPFHLYEDLIVWIQTIDCDREICAIRKRLSPLNKVPRGKM